MDTLQRDNLPLVTVIVPCFNCENLVSRAINSVLNQSYPDIELILIDNNSTDQTLQVLKKFEQQYDGKISVYTEDRKGACAARNKGLRMARGEWIQFLDADDEIMPQKIERQISKAATNDADIVIDDYKKVRIINGKPLTQDIRAENDPWIGVINSSLGITSANLWRKEAVLDAGGWNETLGSSQEYDLLFRLLRNKAKVVVTHYIHTIVYAQPNSVSRSTTKEKLYEQVKNRYDLRCRIYEYLHQNGLLNSTYAKSLYSYLYFHLLLISQIDFPYFKEQIKKCDFTQMGLIHKIKAYILFLRKGIKRKFIQSNLLFKAAEFQYVFFQKIHLLWH